MTYDAVMRQALEEFRGWEDARPSLRIDTATVRFERPPRRPRCACGQLHFAKGMCRRHYMQQYNATRPRRQGRYDNSTLRVRRFRARRKQARHQ